MTQERPILFSGPMVRAILDGRKTQTRRVVKQKVGGHETINDAHAICKDGRGDWIAWFGRGGEFGGRLFQTDSEYAEFTLRAYPDGGGFACPYGKPGDSLWVRENCWVFGKWIADGKTPTGKTKYKFVAHGKTASYEPPGLGKMTYLESTDPGFAFKPSIHMPRWASRIALEVIGVRAERVQDISHKDALAEGVAYDVSKPGGAPVPSFRGLWDSINAGRGYGWDVNPWVWVIEFKRIEP